MRLCRLKCGLAVCSSEIVCVYFVPLSVALRDFAIVFFSFCAAVFVQYCYYNQMLDIFSDTMSDEIKNSESTTHICPERHINRTNTRPYHLQFISSHAIIYIRFPFQMFACVWYSLRVANLARILNTKWF